MYRYDGNSQGIRRKGEIQLSIRPLAVHLVRPKLNHGLRSHFVRDISFKIHSFLGIFFFEPFGTRGGTGNSNTFYHTIPEKNFDGAATIDWI